MYVMYDALLVLSIFACVWQIAKAASDQAQPNRAAASASAAAGGESYNTSAFMITD